MDKLFERPILIWSEYCNYSKNFIGALVKHNELYESFVRVNIDVDPNTHRRPALFSQIQAALKFKIQQVPTIIVNGGEYILSGVEAFKWLDYTINKQQVVQEELQGFNPVEMGSFSDSYAKYGSTKLHDATEQSFKFLDKQDQRIETPQEDGALSPEEIMRKQRERENMDISTKAPSSAAPRPQFTESFGNVNGGGGGVGNGGGNRQLNLSEYANARNGGVMVPKVANNRIDFTNDKFGFAGEINGGSGGGAGGAGITGNSRSQLKQKEIDMRLQQLLADRESTVPQPVARH